MDVLQLCLDNGPLVLIKLLPERLKMTQEEAIGLRILSGRILVIFWNGHYLDCMFAFMEEVLPHGLRCLLVLTSQPQENSVHTTILLFDKV